MKAILARPRFDEERLCSLSEAGATQAQIASILGCSQQYISKLEKLYGIIRHHYWQHDELELLREHYQDLTYDEMAQLLGRRPQAIKNMRYRLDLDLKRLPNPWTPSPTKDLAYVLGVLKGDGHVRKSGQALGLNCNDESFAVAFKSALETIGLRPKLKWRNNQWHVWDCNKDFGDWYLGLDGHLRDYLMTPDMVKAFIRGLYDSEGSLEKTNNEYHHHAVVFYNSNQKLLHLIQQLLAQCSLHSVLSPHHRAGRQSKFNGKTIITRKDQYRLGIYKQTHVERFLREISSNITRKAEKNG